MPNLNEEDLAQLTAYLDGELDEESIQAFEARLAQEPTLRTEAEAMKKTWDLLEFLPRSQPSVSFTHRTLERITVQDMRPLNATSFTGWPRWILAVGWAVVVALVFFGGYEIGQRMALDSGSRPSAANAPSRADVETQILRDLEVVKRKRLYEHADDLEFTRALPDIFSN